MRQLIVPTIVIVLVASVTVIVGLLLVRQFSHVVELQPKPNFREASNNLNHAQIAFLRDSSNKTAAQDYITKLVESGCIARAQIVAEGLGISNPLLDKVTTYIIKCEELYRRGEGPPQDLAAELIETLRGTPAAELLRFQIAVQYGSVSDWNSSVLNLNQITQLPYEQQPWAEFLKLRSEFELVRISIMRDQKLPSATNKELISLRKRASRLTKLEHPVAGRAQGLIAACYWSQGEIKKSLEAITQLKSASLQGSISDRENLARALVMLVLAPVPQSIAHPQQKMYRLQMCGDLAYLDPERSDWLRIQKELIDILSSSNISMNWQPNIFPALCSAIAPTQASGKLEEFAQSQMNQWEATYNLAREREVKPSKSETSTLVPINDLIIGRLILAARSKPANLAKVESLLASLALNSPNPKLREQAFLEAGRAYQGEKKYADAYRCFKSAADMHMSQEQYALYQAYYVARLGLLEVGFQDKISYLKRAINLGGRSSYRIAAALEIYPWLLVNRDPYLSTFTDNEDWQQISQTTAGLWRWQNMNAPTMPGLCLGYFGVDVKNLSFKQPEQWSNDWDFLRLPVSSAELWIGWDLSDYAKYSPAKADKLNNPMVFAAAQTVCLAKYRNQQSALQFMLEEHNQLMYRGPSKILQAVILKSCFSLRYLEEAKLAAAKHNIPVEWVLAIISAESKGRESSESHAGALGLMQLMPDTAQRFGSEYGDQLMSRITEPEVNINIGTSYLSWLRSRLGSDLPMIAASYNWGIGYVESFKARNPDRGPYTLIETLPILETEYYVKRVLFAVSAYKTIIK